MSEQIVVEKGFNEKILQAVGSIDYLSFNEVIFQDLRSRGHTGALPDMIREFGGWKNYVDAVLA